MRKNLMLEKEMRKYRERIETIFLSVRMECKTESSIDFFFLQTVDTVHIMPSHYSVFMFVLILTPYIHIVWC